MHRVFTQIYTYVILILASVTCVSCGEGEQNETNNILDISKQQWNIASLFTSEVEDKAISEPEEIIVNTREGTLYKGKFSVAKGKQVYFSQGNLQYQASTNTWRFAEHQYDAIGVRVGYDVAPTYDGWVDAFAWGTSGWDSGAKKYQPYSTTNSDYDYQPGGYDYQPGSGCHKFNSLVGKYAKADWGVYNKISNGGDKAGIWRTLTKNEWWYLLAKRPNAKRLLLIGWVNDIKGLILLPDNWKAPKDIDIKMLDYPIIHKRDPKYDPDAVSCIKDGQSEDSIYHIRQMNNFSLQDWMKLEANGAVFLPSVETFFYTKKSRFFSKTAPKPENGIGRYWTSSATNNETYGGFSITISEESIVCSPNSRCKKNFVRLVRDSKGFKNN